MRPQSNAPAPATKVTVKACVVLTATLSGLLIGEIAIRVLGAAPEIKAIEIASDDCVYQRSKNPVLGFELKPNYRNDNPDYTESYESTNAHGQRDIDRLLEKTHGTRRVLLLGDSVVEGHGLAESDTISRQWEDLYEGGSTEVLNFGVSAYCTLAEIELLETKGLAFDPDVVVVIFVENDFDNFNREAFSLGEAVQRPALVKWLFQRSHLFRRTSVQLNLFHLGSDSDPVRWNKNAIGDNNVVDGFKRLKALADREGFKPLIAIWPRFLEDEIVDVPLVSKSDPTPVAERLAAMHGLPSSRLSSVFLRHRSETASGNNPRLYYSSGDGLHPSARGAAIAAAGLKQLVDELVSGEMRADPDPDRVASNASKSSVVDVARALGAAKPDYSRVYHRQGVGFLKDGRYAEAIGQFQKALEEDSEHAGAHGNLGLAYEKMGKLADAKRHYQRAIEMNDSFVQAHYNLARVLLSEGDVNATTSAMVLLRRALEIDPNHTDALNLLGMELGKSGKFAEARTHLERAVDLEPEFSEAHNNLGTVSAATGELEKALEQFKEAVRADPTNQGAISRVQQVERMLEDRQ